MFNSGHDIQIMVKRNQCDYHKIKQYSDKNWYKLFLYCKVIFSVHIFNAFRLAIPSYRPSSFTWASH